MPVLVESFISVIPSTPSEKEVLLAKHDEIVQYGMTGLEYLIKHTDYRIDENILVLTMTPAQFRLYVESRGIDRDPLHKYNPPTSKPNYVQFVLNCEVGNVKYLRDYCYPGYDEWIPKCLACAAFAWNNCGVLIDMEYLLEKVNDNPQYKPMVVSMFDLDTVDGRRKYLEAYLRGCRNDTIIPSYPMDYFGVEFTEDDVRYVLGRLPLRYSRPSGYEMVLKRRFNIED